MNALPSSTRKHSSILQSLGAASLLILTAGCTTIEAPLKSELESPSSTLRLCANWFEQLDAIVDRAGVRDAGAYRIPGFPYLRVDRFSASFRDQAKDNPQAFDAWITRLKELDIEAREYEIRNLPPQFFPLAGFGDQAAARVNTQHCAAQLAREGLGDDSGQIPVLKIDRRQIDRYAGDIEPRRAPLRHLPAGPAHRPQPDLLDQAAFFGQRNEL